MSEQNDTATDLAIAAINNSISVINSLATKCHNIIYDSTLNKTKVYGHTNFEELNVLGSPVALQSQLPDMSTKANAIHTHEINDIVLTYEEEETPNEEEQSTIITKTKPLGDILASKAETIHTHTSADITNWVTVTENFAKLNASNTFTGTQAITGILTIKPNDIERWRITDGAVIYQNVNDNYRNAPAQIITNSNLSSTYDLGIYIGKSWTTGNCAYFNYHNAGNNNVNSYAGIGLRGYENYYKFYRDRVDFIKPLSITGTLTTTGSISSPTITAINETLETKADSNHNHDSTYSAINHTHSITDISNLQTTLDDKAPISHNHNISDINGLTIAFDNIEAAIDCKAYVHHTHQIYEVEDLDKELNDIRGELGDLWDDKVDAFHEHKTDDITRDVVTINEEEASVFETIPLNDILDSKSDIGHTHEISDVSNLQTTLDGKASSNHNHDSTYAPINHNHDLEYSPIGHNHDGTYVPINHTHTIADVSNLQTALDSKASSSHNHSSSQITDLEALKEEIFKMIYPIGSIYITMEAMDDSSYVTVGTEIDPETGIEYPAADQREIQWNGCRWYLLNEGAFLMNVSVIHDPNTNPYLWRLTQSGQTGGEATHTLTTDEMPNHNHNSYTALSRNTYPHLQYYGDYDNVKLEGWANSGVTAGPYTSGTGGGQPHNNLPPYITCYMYKRIA